MIQNQELDTLENVFTLVNNDKPSENEKRLADFETAISATGFGKFNIVLILIAIPSAFAVIFETTSMSFVFPAAHCDLKLSLQDKGMLNAITYVGMISTAFVWGFLCDTLGRKKLLVIGLSLDVLCVIMSASSQNLTLLMTAKFLCGFIVNGPYAALTTYMSEFHAAKHRSRVLMMLGIAFSSGTVVMPLLALGILPLNLNLKPFNNTVVFHSWNLFLLVCGIPAIIGAVGFAFLPETPKFLMTTGRYSKALAVFKTAYALNTGKPKDTFPFEDLIVELQEDTKHGGRITANRTKVQALKEGWQQIKPLFFPPHLYNIVLVCMMQMLNMMSLNTYRLWLPQIFQGMVEYKEVHNGTAFSLCGILDSLRTDQASNGSQAECFVSTNNAPVYYNSMIVAGVTVIGYITAGMLINNLGKKCLLTSLGLLAGVVPLILYFAKESNTIIALSSAFIAFGSVFINVVLAVVVDLFPTALRTMAVSLTMMMGRVGPFIGNLLFPILLQSGCMPPVFFLGSLMITTAFLTFLLPKTDLVALQ